MKNITRDIIRNLRKQNEEEGANNNEKEPEDTDVEKLQVSNKRAMQRIPDTKQKTRQDNQCDSWVNGKKEE